MPFLFSRRATTSHPLCSFFIPVLVFSTAVTAVFLFPLSPVVPEPAGRADNRGEIMRAELRWRDRRSNDDNPEINATYIARPLVDRNDDRSRYGPREASRCSRVPRRRSWFLINPINSKECKGILCGWCKNSMEMVQVKINSFLRIECLYAIAVSEALNDCT